MYYVHSKFFRDFRKKVSSQILLFQGHMSISKFLIFITFECSFCLQLPLKSFYALFDHDVGMKNNLQDQGYPTHVESGPYDSSNVSQSRKSEGHVKLCSFVASLTKVYLTWYEISAFTGKKIIPLAIFVQFLQSIEIQ